MARRTQAERRGEAERRILTAAIELIRHKGLAGLTLAEAGIAAGYSRALAGHYFGSREGLVTALVARVMDRFLARAPLGRGDPSPLAALRAMIAYYLDSLTADEPGWRVYLALLHEALINPGVAAALAPLHARAIDGPADLIRAGIAAGEIRADLDPRAEAALLLASLRGLVALRATYPDHPDFASAARAFAAGVERSLAVPVGPPAPSLTLP